jgi:hypothetical protein
MPSPRRVKKSVRPSKKKSPVKKVKKSKSPVKKACKEGKIRSPKTGRCIKDPSLKKKKSPVKKAKNVKKANSFSDEDIENLMRDAPKMRDKKDEATIKKRLRKFVYDPSYQSEFFRHDEKRSLEENMYFQAAARLAEYGKRYLNANEI